MSSETGKKEAHLLPPPRRVAERRRFSGSEGNAEATPSTPYASRCQERLTRPVEVPHLSATAPPAPCHGRPPERRPDHASGRAPTSDDGTHVQDRRADSARSLPRRTAPSDAAPSAPKAPRSARSVPSGA